MRDIPVTVYLNHHTVVVAEQDFVTVGEFLEWALEAFRLPGVAREYAVLMTHTHRGWYVSNELRPEEPFIRHSNVKFERRDDGLSFDFYIMRTESGCCRIL